MRKTAVGLLAFLSVLSACQQAPVSEVNAIDDPLEVGVEPMETDPLEAVPDETPAPEETPVETPIAEETPAPVETPVAIETPAPVESPVTQPPVANPPPAIEPPSVPKFVRKGRFSTLIKECGVQESAEDSAAKLRTLPTGKRLWTETVNSDWRLVYSHRGPAYMRRECFETAARVEEGRPSDPPSPQAEPAISATPPPDPVQQPVSEIPPAPVPVTAPPAVQPVTVETFDPVVAGFGVIAIVSGLLLGLVVRRKRNARRQFEMTSTFVPN